MITDETNDPEEWYKFWYESDDGECYSPLKCSSSVRGSEFFLSIVSQTEFSG